ncbi:MAG: tetratricopeptide repeat protein [Pyrinomonadaceae bacterium]|nr:tetratricopeptide repeat protein [Pyrinomonadaceae bacterium]
MSDSSNIKELLEQAWSERRVGNYDQARRLVERAEALTKDDNYNSLGRIFHVYAQFDSEHNRYPEALDLYRKSLENYKKADVSDKIAHSTRHVADVLRKLGNDAESEAAYREAIEVYRANPNSSSGDLANALAGFAEILEKRGKISEAIAAWEETKELYQQCGIQAGVEQAKRKLDSF